MFRNSDSYFNINNYHNLLFLIVAFGLFLVFIKLCTRKRMLGFPTFLVLFAWIVLLNSKYMIGNKAEPYYIMFIVTLLLYLMCMAELDFDFYNVKFMVNAYIASAVLMSAIILIQHRTPYAQYGIFRWALFFSKYDYYDVNFTALYLLVPALLSFYGAIKGSKRNRWKYLLCVGVILLAILMLGSRGTFAPVIAIMAFLILHDKKVSVSKIAIILAVLIAVFFFLPEDIFSRLIGTSYIGSESKRYIDWAYGMRVFSNSPIWGSGMRAPQTLVNEIGGGVMNYTIHNTYIVYLAQLGIVGSIPFFSILLYPIIYMAKNYKDIYTILMYCGVLFASMMIEANYSYVLFVPLSIFYMLIHYVKRNKINKGLLDKIFQGELKNEFTKIKRPDSCVQR